MQKLKDLYRGLSFGERSIPLALLLTCVLGFGLLIGNLGFYMDDWPYVFYAYNKGLGSLAEMLVYDSRPNAAWLYISAFTLLGFNPLVWQIAMLVLRWVTAMLLWATLRTIWPGRTREITALALLFSVYPFFMLQSSAVGSTHLWTGFILFSLSLFLMVRAVSGGKYWLPASLAAVALAVLHLFSSEYYAGLELVRPLILWILLSRKEANPARLTRSVLLNWLPYLLALGGYAFWRVFIYQNPPDVVRNSPVVLLQLLHQPVQAIGYLFNAAARDSLSVLTYGWQQALDAHLLDFGTPFGIFRMLVSLGSFVLLATYLGKLAYAPAAAGPADDWAGRSVLLGAMALLVADLPIWLEGRTFIDSLNLVSASRFGMPAMFGAAFLIILLVEALARDKRTAGVLVAALVALSINVQLNITKGFQASWEKQLLLYQELTWRAPQIQPGTAIVTDQEILGNMGGYATSFAINTLYQPGPVRTPPYWFFPVYYTYPNISDFVKGIPIKDNKLSMQFNGESTDSLVISFNPEQNSCLWILGPQDGNLNLLSPDMRRLSAASDLARIGENSGADRNLPVALFGNITTRGWCYYFEKADLARQYGHWDQIVALDRQAKAAGQQPGNGFEYIPFIEGYAHTGDWQTVQAKTRMANRVSKGMQPRLCELLGELRTQTPGSTQKDQTLDGLQQDLGCSKY